MIEAPHHVAVEDVASTQWLTLQTIKYVDKRGNPRHWDRCVRRAQQDPKELPSLPAGATTAAAAPALKTDADCACVVALTKSSDEGQTPSMVFVRQYRPALNAFTIELPAGLVDPGESAQDAGLRELREETGFTASQVLYVSPKVSLSPGIGTESVFIVCTEVDLDSLQNKNPKQNLSEDEEVEVVILPCGKSADLITALNKLAAEGNVIFDGVYCIALGMVMAGSGCKPLEALRRLGPCVAESQ